MPVQEDQSKDPSLHRLLQSYCKHDLFLVHRIDRPVSGAVLFAKSNEALQALVKQNESGEFRKTYLAIVPCVDMEPEGEFEDRLVHDTRHHKARVADADAPAGKTARLHYKILESLDRYRLLEIRTESGRFHQIRMQLSSRQMPIFGDVKYGARRGQPDRSIGLHAWKIRWRHHRQNSFMEFEAPVPSGGLWSKFTVLQNFSTLRTEEHDQPGEEG